MNGWQSWTTKEKFCPMACSYCYDEDSKDSVSKDSKDSSDSNDDDKKLGFARRGGLNERCHFDGSCDYGVPEWEHLEGQALEVCWCRGYLGAANEDKKLGFARRGGLNERCHLNGDCDYGVPEWEHLEGQALEVCWCRGYLGASNEEPKLGMRAPHMGNEGEPCFYGQYCNSGLYCKKYTTDGTSISATCVRGFHPYSYKAQKGQKCGSSAQYGHPRICDVGLYCKRETLLGCRGWNCSTHVCVSRWN